MTPAIRAAVLDEARMSLTFDLAVPDATDEHVETRLVDHFGAVTLPLSRWFDIWKYSRVFLATWDRLNFQMQGQQQSNWCWAATATSVALFYDPKSTWTQCGVANSQLNRTDCCASGASVCNVYGYLDKALTTVGHFDHWASGAATFDNVDTEITAGRPLGVRVAWSGGGAHFFSVIGYLPALLAYVAVDDPIYGKSDVSYATLQTAYQGSGTWTDSYYTQA